MKTFLAVLLFSLSLTAQERIKVNVVETMYVPETATSYDNYVSCHRLRSGTISCWDNPTVLNFNFGQREILHIEIDGNPYIYWAVKPSRKLGGVLVGEQNPLKVYKKLGKHSMQTLLRFRLTDGRDMDFLMWGTPTLTSENNP